jgi:hypothetical protein
MSRLPGVEEGTSHGTAAWYMRKRLLARMHQDGESLVVRTTFDDREVLLRMDPRVFHFTDHYRNYPTVLVRLAAVSRGQLGELLEAAWRRCAPKKDIAAYEERRPR